MKTPHKTLSFAQMMVRAQQRHDRRVAPGLAAAPSPERRAAQPKPVSLWFAGAAA
ncbi:hypothetical protein [Rhizobacter sp. Root1221]|uniref:hypothetical protein n=1 Tax=Rhizobacter sp. Root1221 TaxID=1736433 RepID=UPI000AA4975A|nr:hypothetical protein [Rhizobacter sp. Root1221]